MIGAYLVNPVTLKSLASRDQWNEPTWTSTELMGKVDWGSRLVRNFKGEEVVSSALVYLANTVPAVTHEDRLVIAGVEHQILRIEKKEDFSFSHWEVWIA